MTDHLAPPSRRAFPGTSLHAAAARHWLIDELGGKDHPAADAVALVGGELITNAIRHSRSGQDGGEFRVALSTGDIVRIGVYDQGGTCETPEVRAESLTATGGRGLALVAAMAKRWGTRTTVDGLLVWAEVQA